MPSAQRITCDYLVLGTGLAGLFAALRAAEHGSVIAISKTSLEECNTRYAQGGVACVIAEDDTFDAIHSRDMLGHVEDLEGALAECKRVLKPGGAMVIHDVYATPRLEPMERARFVRDLAQVDARLDGELFEQAVVDAGFTIESVDPVGSEWLETTLEQADGETRLLRAARMNRQPDRYIEQMGEIPFRVVQGNDLWTIYRMIGKLEDRVHVIRAS